MHVYIADDDPEVRSALRLLVEQKLRGEVVGEAAHTHGLISLVESAGADLVILDWELPGRVDARLLTCLHVLDLAPRIVVTSSHHELERQIVAAGADAFAGKGDPAERLLAALTESSQE
jgi:DNA-binding NarL/FixJ family response regulator